MVYKISPNVFKKIRRFYKNARKAHPASYEALTNHVQKVVNAMNMIHQQPLLYAPSQHLGWFGKYPYVCSIKVGQSRNTQWYFAFQITKDGKIWIRDVDHGQNLSSNSYTKNPLYISSEPPHKEGNILINEHHHKTLSNIELIKRVMAFDFEE